MVSNDIDINFNLNTTESSAKAEELQNELDTLAENALKIEKEIMRTVAKGLSSLRRLTSVAKNIIIATGGALDDAGEAMFSLIDSTFTIMISSAQGYAAAGPIGFVIALGLATAAVQFQVYAKMQAEMGLNMASIQTNAAAAALEGLGSLLRY